MNMLTIPQASSTGNPHVQLTDTLVQAAFLAAGLAYRRDDAGYAGMTAELLDLVGWAHDRAESHAR